MAAVWGCLGAVTIFKWSIYFAYHLSYGLDEILMVGVAAFCLPAVAGAAIGRWVDARGRLARLGTAILVLTYVKANALPDLPTFWRAALYLGFALLAALVVLAPLERPFRTVANALIAASTLYMLSFPLAAWIMPPAGESVLGGGWLQGSDRPRIFLVLDEFDPAYAARLADRLRERGAAYQYQLNDAAGHSTINAIPAMLVGRRFDDVFECGARTICGSNSLDLGRLTAARQDVDVVAFWHPYCAVRGLRSCYEQMSAFSETTSLEARLACMSVPFLARVIACQPSGRGLEATRARMTATVDRAPFWRLGGLLYVHVPLPHPTGELPAHSLKAEYEANVDQAVEMVDALLLRARASFGGGFEIDVTADHPLRVEQWCRAPAYAGPDCGRDLPRTHDRVPFFLISGDSRTAVLPAPATNIGILK